MSELLAVYERARIFLGGSWMVRQAIGPTRAAWEMCHELRGATVTPERTKRLRKVLWSLDLSKEPSASTERKEIIKGLSQPIYAKKIELKCNTSIFDATKSGKGILDFDEPSKSLVFDATKFGKGILVAFEHSIATDIAAKMAAFALGGGVGAATGALSSSNPASPAEPPQKLDFEGVSVPPHDPVRKPSKAKVVHQTLSSDVFEGKQGKTTTVAIGLTGLFKIDKVTVIDTSGTTDVLCMRVGRTVVLKGPIPASVLGPTVNHLRIPTGTPGASVLLDVKFLEDSDFAFTISGTAFL